jgi:hypothetical protein
MVAQNLGFVAWGIASEKPLMLKVGALGRQSNDPFADTH